MKAVKQIATTVTMVDLETGKETHAPAAFNIMPPADGRCQICATKHEPGNPHNAQSLYYHMTFASMVGRAPTWADAMAHCDDATKTAWTAELINRGAYSRPPEGEEPVAHHGVEA